MIFAFHNLDSNTWSKIKSLCKKIVEEHFNITLSYDRNLNYLFYLYKDGTKKGDVTPFILISELNLLLALDIINENEKEKIQTMLYSEDSDNVYMALLALENFRKKRIKIHGNWIKTIDVSKEFIQVAEKYKNIVFPDNILRT
jgi:hypothetical protein